jgi:pyridoxal phosphate enzyme (YggS family)
VARARGPAREAPRIVSETTSDVASALADVRARIERACKACGRDAADVKLVAVSKTKPADAVREAYAAGQRAFGENYAQELESKAEALSDLVELEWHFIGHLQSNKAKLVARAAHVVHTVDGAPLARELAKRALAVGRAPLPVMIEVNIGGEAQKHGASPGDIAEVMAAVNATGALTLRGLMTMPPADDLDVARSVFSTLSSLRTLHGGASVLPELSMGMSHDLEIAIACGATIVRVGTAIFGAR